MGRNKRYRLFAKLILKFKLIDEDSVDELYHQIYDYYVIDTKKEFTSSSLNFLGLLDHLKLVKPVEDSIDCLHTAYSTGAFYYEQGHQ